MPTFPVRRRSAVGTICAYAAVLAAALAVALHGVGNPWWETADPDGAYVGNSLNILLGNHTDYIDHPGLPTQDALALAFGTQYLVEKGLGTFNDRQAFADDRMLHLDNARWIYRTWAVLLFVGGALLTCRLVGRLLGHWSWGLAGGLLFVATPGFLEIAHMLRPDAAMAALSLGVAYLIATGFERASAARYVAAAMLLGLAVSFKLTALGLAVPLLVAAAWRAPRPGWAQRLRNSAARSFRRHRLWLVPLTAVWVVLCVVFDRERLPIVTNGDQRHILVNGGAVLGGYLACTVLAQTLRIPWSRRVFTPLFSLLAVAVVAGFALPSSLILDDGMQSASAVWQSLRGERVNAHIDAFGQFSAHTFLSYPLSAATILFALAAAGAVVAVRRRRYWPAVLALGTLVLALMAAARFSFDYYYAPAYALAIPSALWLFRRERSAVAPPYVWIVVAAVVVPLLWRLPSGADTVGAVNASAQQLADRLLKPGEVILTPATFPVEDTRYGSFVRAFADHTPDFPYRFIGAGDLPVVVARGLRPAYYVARNGDLTSAPQSGVGQVELEGRGPFTVERLPTTWGPGNEYGVLAIRKAPEGP